MTNSREFMAVYDINFNYWSNPIWKQETESVCDTQSDRQLKPQHE